LGNENVRVAPKRTGVVRVTREHGRERRGRRVIGVRTGGSSWRRAGKHGEAAQERRRDEGGIGKSRVGGMEKTERARLAKERGY